MDHRRPGMSITLPRNFAYHSTNANEPRTPEQTFTEMRLPPPPHHSTCRIRRPRFDFSDPPDELPSLHASDIPIPSIEVQRDTREQRPFWQQRATEPSPSVNLHLSARHYPLAPKTPPPPTQSFPRKNEQISGVVERPSSVCSNFSDSSVSSDGSFTSPPSFGGSCTSPESDFQDPFTSVGKSLSGTPSKIGRLRTKSLMNNMKPKWTPEMDNHLWNTYQIYLQDPTITPFKMVPGSLPPLGVSHRVAREAKRTWSKAARTSGQAVNQPSFRNVLDDSHAVASETPTIQTGSRSGSSTPTMPSSTTPKIVWPRSESATRRRLKELCKRKFTIAPHYQRLLQSRSPSPFPDQLSRRTSSSRSSSLAAPSLSYATRDLGISLASTGATSQLAQLATDDSIDERDEDVWFNTPPELGSSSKNTVHTGLGIDGLQALGNIPRLGSPFMYKTWGPGRSRHQARPTTPMDQIHGSQAPDTEFLSPMNVDVNANKRRAQHQLEDELSPGGTDLQTRLQMDQSFLNMKPSEYTLRRVRLRNRGVTLGAVSGRETLNSLFNLSTKDTRSEVSSSIQPQGLAPPAEEIKRLGSPFELAKPGHFKNRSPRHGPSMSDPFVSNPFASQSNRPSINETLAALKGADEGLPDAERIRQQILNLQRHRT